MDCTAADMPEATMPTFAAFFHHVFDVKTVLYLTLLQASPYVFIGEVNVRVSNGFDQKSAIPLVRRLLGGLSKSSTSVNPELAVFLPNHVSVAILPL